MRRDLETATSHERGLSEGGSSRLADSAAAVEGPIGTGDRELAGDPAQVSFDELFAALGGPIYNYACRLLDDPGEAEDVTQEVFLKAYRRLSLGERFANPRAWLYQAARWTCRDHLRHRGRRAASELEDDRVVDRGDDFARAEVAALVDETLRRVGERHRQALILRDLQGLRHDEIAVVLGVTTGAAQALVARARAAFQREFTRLALGTQDRGSQGDPPQRASLGDLLSVMPVLALPPGLAALPQALGASAGAAAAAGATQSAAGGLLAKIGGGAVVKSVVAALVVAVGVGVGVQVQVARRHSDALSHRGVPPMVAPAAWAVLSVAVPPAYRAAPSGRTPHGATTAGGDGHHQGATGTQGGGSQTGGEDAQGPQGAQGDNGGAAATDTQGAVTDEQGASSSDQGSGQGDQGGAAGGDGSSHDGPRQRTSDQGDQGD